VFLELLMHIVEKLPQSVSVEAIRENSTVSLLYLTCSFQAMFDMQTNPAQNFKIFGFEGRHFFHTIKKKS
jgi:hypothetical protein